MFNGLKLHYNYVKHQIKKINTNWQIINHNNNDILWLQSNYTPIYEKGKKKNK